MGEMEAALESVVADAIKSIDSLITTGNLDIDVRKEMDTIRAIYMTGLQTPEHICVATSVYLPLVSAFEKMHHELDSISFHSQNPLSSKYPLLLNFQILDLLLDITAGYLNIICELDVAIWKGNILPAETLCKLLMPFALLSHFPRYIKKCLDATLQVKASGGSAEFLSLAENRLSCNITYVCQLNDAVGTFRSSLEENPYCSASCFRPFEALLYNRENMMALFKASASLFEASVQGHLPRFPDEAFLHFWESFGTLIHLYRPDYTALFEIFLQRPFPIAIIGTQARLGQLCSSSSLNSNSVFRRLSSLLLLITFAHGWLIDVMYVKFTQENPQRRSAPPAIDESMCRKLLTIAKTHLIAVSAPDCDWSPELRSFVRACALGAASMAGVASLFAYRTSKKPYSLAFIAPPGGITEESVELVVGSWQALISNPLACDPATTLRLETITGRFICALTSSLISARVDHLRKHQPFGVPEATTLLHLTERLGNFIRMAPEIMACVNDSSDSIVTIFHNAIQLGMSCAGMLDYCQKPGHPVSLPRPTRGIAQLRREAAALKGPVVAASHAWSQALHVLCASLENWSAALPRNVSATPGLWLYQGFDGLADIQDLLLCYDTKIDSNILRNALHGLVLENLDLVTAIPEKYYRSDDLGTVGFRFVDFLYYLDNIEELGYYQRDLPGLKALGELCAEAGCVGQQGGRGGGNPGSAYLIKNAREYKVKMDWIVNGIQRMTDTNIVKEVMCTRATGLLALPCSHLGCTTMRQFGEEKVQAKLCAGCKSVRYCGAVCQKKDWKEHKVVCKMLAARRAAASGGDRA